MPLWVKKKKEHQMAFFLQRTKLFTERNFKGADSLFLSWNTHNPLHSRLGPSGYFKNVNLFHSTVQFTRWIMLLKEQHLPDKPGGILLFMWPFSFLCLKVCSSLISASCTSQLFYTSCLVWSCRCIFVCTSAHISPICALPVPVT